MVTGARASQLLSAAGHRGATVTPLGILRRRAPVRTYVQLEVFRFRRHFGGAGGSSAFAPSRMVAREILLFTDPWPPQVKTIDLLRFQEKIGEKS